MAYQTYDHSIAASGSIFSRVNDWAAHTVARVGAWTSERRRAAELGRLDDRLLHDIGLSRSEISSVAHNPTDITRIR